MHLRNSSHSKANHQSMATYIVPCVAKAVHIVEILRMAPSGLHVAELRSITGYPPSTIYRILRTFVGCGYMHHTMRGAYVLNLKVIHAKEPEPGVDGTSDRSSNASKYRAEMEAVS